eukprot:COSAG02_NODE_26_length_51927_cov_61.213881_7_plen_111_part_00
MCICALSLYPPAVPQSLHNCGCCRDHTTALCAESVINTEISLTEEEIVQLLKESGRVFEQNNALVATVQNSDAFATASKACTAWVLKVLGATLVAAGAAYAYRQRASSLR